MILISGEALIDLIPDADEEGRYDAVLGGSPYNVAIGLARLADDLGITLSRTAYRHPDGNAFIERVFKTYKEEAVWPYDFQSFEEAKAELERWLIDYNEERPHSSLGDLTPAEARAEALTNHKIAA